VTTRAEAEEIDAKIEAAIQSLPYEEQMPKASQLRRDWLAVREYLLRARARIVSIKSRS